LALKAHDSLDNLESLMAKRDHGHFSSAHDSLDGLTSTHSTASKQDGEEKRHGEGDVIRLTSRTNRAVMKESKHQNGASASPVPSWVAMRPNNDQSSKRMEVSSSMSPQPRYEQMSSSRSPSRPQTTTERRLGQSASPSGLRGSLNVNRESQAKPRLVSMLHPNPSSSTVASSPIPSWAKPTSSPSSNRPSSPVSSIASFSTFSASAERSKVSKSLKALSELFKRGRISREERSQLKGLVLDENESILTVLEEDVVDVKLVLAVMSRISSSST